MGVSPTRRSLLQILLLIWQVSRTASHNFVWGAVHEGAIDLGRQSRVIRIMTVFGLVLILGFLLSMIFNDSLRQNGPLELLSNDSTATRALLVPSIAVPITFVAVAIGWGYMLAGAIHARLLVRWGLFVVYLLCGVSPLLLVLNPSTAGGLTLLAVGCIVGMVVLFVVLPLLRIPKPVTWCLIILLHTGVVITAMRAAGQLQQLTNEYWLNTTLSGMVQITFIFIVPFLVIAGLGWINFALEVSRWAVSEVRVLLRPVWLIGLLLIILIIRISGLIRPLFDGIEPQQWRAWIGAGILCAGLFPLALWRRVAQQDAVSGRMLVWLAILLPTLQMLIIIALQLATLLLIVTALTPELPRLQNQLNAVLLNFSDLVQQYRALGVAFVGVILAIVAYQRNRKTVAAFGMVLAWSALLSWLTRDDQLLAAWQFSYSDVDAILLLLICAVTLFWLVRRQLTADRTIRLLALSILLALLNQTDFLDNPFSPLFAFAGIFFLVFGIVWNILTAAGNFVNQDTPRLSRDSRVLLYLGYVLLSVSVTHWYLVSHNLLMQSNQTIMNELGFTIVGLPLAYLMLVERGRPLVEQG
jgi:hypothetical protein